MNKLFLLAALAVTVPAVKAGESATQEQPVPAPAMSEHHVKAEQHLQNATYWNHFRVPAAVAYLGAALVLRRVPFVARLPLYEVAEHSVGFLSLISAVGYANSVKQFERTIGAMQKA